MSNQQETAQENYQGANLDEIRSLLSVLPEPNPTAGTQARMKLNDKGLNSSVGSSDIWGPYGDLVDWFFAHSKDKDISLDRPRLVVFATAQETAINHIDGDSLSKTQNLLDGFVGGSAPASHLCGRIDAELRVYEMDLDTPSADVTQSPSLDSGAGAQAMAYGMMCVEQGIDLLALSEISYGNDANVSALVAHLLDEDINNWAVLPNHVDIMQKMTKPNDFQLGDIDALDAVVHYGGLEICALTGAILAARMGRVPVILDSYASCAAALVLEKCRAGSTSHCIVASPQHRIHKNLAQSLHKIIVHQDIATYPTGVASMIALAPLRGFVDMGLL